MNNKLVEFVNWTEENNWEIRHRRNPEVSLPDEVASRYKEIPDTFKQFLQLLDVCITPDEKSWIICLNDYCGISDIAFSWNEFEKISLEAAEGDREWEAEITSFWDGYFPIALSVRNGYSYFALDLKNDYGSVVYGYEPEFEEIEKIADSFVEFLDGIMQNTIEF